LIVGVDAAIDEALSLLVRADEKLLIDEVDQFAQSFLVNVEICSGCFVEEEAESRVTVAVYFDVFCHRNYAV
jgi:hypothetical protein